MARLDPLEVFTYYHLGFDRDYSYRFRNLHDAARYFGVSADELQAFLLAHRMDAETIRHVDFNLSARHVEAQLLDMDGASVEQRHQHAVLAFQEYRRALEATYDQSREFEDIDWEDPLGRGEAE